MATRAPWFDFTINRKTLDEAGFRSAIDSIEFVEDVGKFDKVTMVLNQGPSMFRAATELKFGSVMQLSMGYYNESVLPMTVVFLHSIEPDFGQRTVTYQFMGYMKSMDVNETDRNLNNKSVLAIVQEVVSDYAVLEVGNIEFADYVLSDTTSQSKQTDFSLLEGIAKNLGGYWKIEPIEGAKGKWSLSLYKMEYDKASAKNFLPLHAHPDAEFVPEDKSIKLKGFTPKSNILGVSSRIEIRSNNPNQPVAVSTDMKDSKSEPDYVTGSEIVATVFGEVTRFHFQENVSDEEAAALIAKQLKQEDELSFVSVPETQVQEGIPNLRLGNTQTVVPHGIDFYEKVFEGEYLISGSRHRISASGGYDTWIKMNMNAWKIPPASEIGGGYGSGVPVLIYVYPNGTAEGWYIYFTSDGTPTKGAYITQSEIESNSYWLSKIGISTAYFSIGSSSSGGTALSGIMNAYGFGPSESGGIPNVAYSNGSLSITPIDWPSEYNTDVLGLIGVANSVHNGAEGTEAIETEGSEFIFAQPGDEDYFAQRAALLQQQNFVNGILNSARNPLGIGGN